MLLLELGEELDEAPLPELQDELLLELEELDVGLEEDVALEALLEIEVKLEEELLVGMGDAMTGATSHAAVGLPAGKRRGGEARTRAGDGAAACAEGAAGCLMMASAGRRGKRKNAAAGIGEAPLLGLEEEPRSGRNGKKSCYWSPRRSSMRRYGWSSRTT